MTRTVVLGVALVGTVVGLGARGTTERQDQERIDTLATRVDIVEVSIDQLQNAMNEGRFNSRDLVQAYLERAWAHTKFPGLRAYVSADPASQTIRVRLTAPLHLPLKVPGGQESAVIGATGAAVVAVDP